MTAFDEAEKQPGAALAETLPVVPLTAAELERRWPTVRPKDAATMIILDRSGSEPKVLMGRRHPGHKFMPGKFVFPGGRIEASDRRMAACGALNSVCEGRLMSRVQRPTLSRARALALSAIRETFEETGLMFGQSGLGHPQAPAGSTWESFAEHGVFPDLEAVTLIARAITPPGRPKRFDTRFFLIDSTQAAHRVADVVGPDSELVEIVSVTFPEAIALDLPTITRTVLADLQNRIAGNLAPHLPVPFYYESRGAYRRDTL
jgi:8-oxo-dGTP pyrophosphatase MutT (NUDIX family)